jgi:hypothetical protein
MIAASINFASIILVLKSFAHLHRNKWKGVGPENWSTTAILSRNVHSVEAYCRVEK